MILKKFFLYLTVCLSIFLFTQGFLALELNTKDQYPVKYVPTKIGKQKKDKKIQKDNINILVLGLDEEEIRTDVIALINYSSSSNGMNILSVARDTKINYNGKTVKMNALMGLGGEVLIAEKIEEITGLPVNYYITLNFKGFREIIDILGGVEIDVPINMKYDDPEQNLHIDIKKGRQLLDGKKAEEFVRYRKGNFSGQGYKDGDLGRIKSQQILISELISQKFKVKYLLKANEIFYSLKKHMKTNIEAGDISTLINSTNNLDTKITKTYTLPGDSKYINNVWYYIYDIELTHKLIEDNFYQ